MINKKLTNLLWRGKTPRHSTFQPRQTFRQIQCVINRNHVSNCDQIMRLYASRTRFTHLWAVLNCILHSTVSSYLDLFCSRPETASDVISGRFVAPIARNKLVPFILVSSRNSTPSCRRRHFWPFFERRSITSDRK